MKKLKLFIALGTLLTLLPAQAKIQQQGIKTLSDCITAGATGATCLPLAAQIWDSTNSQTLAASIAANAFSGSVSSSYLISNLGLTASVSASALTVAMKTAAGSTPSSGSGKVEIGYRNATLGQYSLIDTTGALSVVVPSTATLGQVSGAAEYTYIYAQNNAGTTQLCVSTSTDFDEGTVQTSTTISTGATSRSVLYCTAGATGAIRKVGRLLSTQTTAGTWAAAPSQTSLTPFISNQKVSTRYYTSSFSLGSPPTIINYATKDYDDLSAVTTGASWKFTAPVAGVYDVSACLVTAVTGHTAGFAAYMQLYKNGSVHSTMSSHTTGVTETTTIPYVFCGPTSVPMVAGDYIDVRITNLSAETSSANIYDNWISISKQ